MPLSHPYLIAGVALVVLLLFLLFALAILSPLTFIAILLVLGGLALMVFRPQQWWAGLAVLVIGLIAALAASAAGGLALSTTNIHWVIWAL